MSESTMRAVMARGKAAPLAAAVALATAICACASGEGAVTADDTAHPSAATSPAPRFSDPQTIDNRFLPVTERNRCEHRGAEHDGTRTRSVQTLLDSSKRFEVGGQAVEAVVVQDKAYAGGELVEVTLDYFAQADDGTVYYLGEDVDNLSGGKVVAHDGSWLYGRDTDALGVAMPAEPQVGDQFRFEDVPGVTAESNRVEEVGMRAAAGGSVHTEVVRIQEFVQPEGEVEYKLYAPGVGLIVEYPPDGRAELVACR